MFEKIKMKLAEKTAGLVLKARKVAPELWLGTGLVLIAADVVLAVRAGTRLKETVQPRYTNIKTYKNHLDLAETNGLTVEEEKSIRLSMNQEQRLLFKDLVLEFVPVIIINAAGCFCIFRAYNILRSWNTGLVVAYNSLLEAYTALRTNNAMLNGQNADLIAAREGESGETTDPETGEVYKYIKCREESKADYFGRVFNENTSAFWSTYWTKNPEAVLNFIEVIRCQAEDKGNRNGFVSFADALSGLGLPTEAYTFVTGWKRPENPQPGWLSFGIEKYSEEALNNYRRGMYPSLILEFNCTGLIIDCLDSYALEKGGKEAREI